MRNKVPTIFRCKECKRAHTEPILEDCDSIMMDCPVCKKNTEWIIDKEFA